MPRVSAREIGRRWEEDVKVFFNSLGFDVDGGDSFMPGGQGNQIDVVAGFGNTLLIGECKTKAELGERNSLASEIRKFKKKIEPVIKEFAEGENGQGYHSGKYHHYKHFVAFVATKDIVFTNPDFEALNERSAEDPNTGKNIYTYLMDEEFFEYYNSIKEELQGDIARFNLLADLSIHLQKSETFKTLAFKSIIKGYEIYNFVATPQELLPYVTVARRHARKKEYYQRMIDGSRCQDIIDYIDRQDALFPRGHLVPSNIILATNPDFFSEDASDSRQLSVEPITAPDLDFPNNIELVELRFPSWYGPFWVVDGQHRLYAFSKKSKTMFDRTPQIDDKVSVTLMHKLGISQQSQIFVDINDKQKGVEFDYILDIEGEANPLSIMGRISNTIKKLDDNFKTKVSGEEFENIFYKKIKIPSHGIKRKFSMKGFYYAIKRKNLIPPDNEHRKTSSGGENPFFINANLSNKGQVYDAIDKLIDNMTIFFSIAKMELGDNIQKLTPSPKYNLNNTLEAHGKDGLIDVLIGLYERIIAANNIKLDRTAIPLKNDFKKYLKPVAERLSKIKNEEEYSTFINTSGHGNRLDSERRMCHVIREAGYPEFDFDDIDFDINKIAESCIELETKLKELINTKLCEQNPDWCKGQITDLLPTSVYNLLELKASGDLQRNPNLIDQGRLYVLLDIGQCRDLILKHWDLGFNTIFVVGGDKFRDKNQFIEAINHLSLYRNTRLHGMLSQTERSIIREQSQKDLAESYLKTLDKALEPLQLNEPRLEATSNDEASSDMET